MLIQQNNFLPCCARGLCPVICEEMQWDGECGKSSLELLKLELDVRGVELGLGRKSKCDQLEYPGRDSVG